MITLSTNDNLNVQNVMGVPIFQWLDWGESYPGCLQFKEVTFLLPELRKFNGLRNEVVSLDVSGFLEVIDENRNVVFNDYLSNIDSFKKAL